MVHKTMNCSDMIHATSVCSPSADDNMAQDEVDIDTGIYMY